MFERLKIELHTARMTGFDEIEIWVEDGKLHYAKDLFGMRIVPVKIDPDGTIHPGDEDAKGVSDVPVEDFSEKMELLHIESWKKTYEPEGYMVLDGENWDLTYKTVEGKPIVIAGDNAYPKEWNKLIKYIRLWEIPEI